MFLIYVLIAPTSRKVRIKLPQIVPETRIYIPSLLISPFQSIILSTDLQHVTINSILKTTKSVKCHAMDLDDTQGKHQIPFPRTRGRRIKHQEYKVGSVYLGHADNKSLSICLKKFFSPLKKNKCWHAMPFEGFSSFAGGGAEVGGQRFLPTSSPY